MTVEALAHINLRVPPASLRAVKDFYCDVLGLSEGWRPSFSSKGHWLYAADQPIVHLVEASPHESRALQSGAIDHVAFRSTDLAGTTARLEATGVPFAKTRVPDTGDVQLFLRDPVGTGVELTFGKEEASLSDS